MDFAWTDEQRALRAEARQVARDAVARFGRFNDTWMNGYSKEFSKELAARGWIGMTWPVEHGGGGRPPIDRLIVAEEMIALGAPIAASWFADRQMGPALMTYGTAEQQRTYLPGMLAGEDTWCIGMSEPNAGSDLGNLGCRAVLDGDEWVINGQKIWTTAGHLANHIFVLARTAPDEVKHRGITFLLVDMQQPGVEVRPIRMMSGESEFCEVFFTDARCPKGNVVGEVHGGWMVAMTLLGNERGAGAAVNAIAFRAELDKLNRLAKERGLSHDPQIRQRLAKAHTKVEVMRFLGYRALTAFMNGKKPGPDASIGKLFWSEYHKEVTELAIDILGADALTPSGTPAQTYIRPDAVGSPNSSASWVDVFMNARAGTIYAGSSQVQRGIVGEQILGLPKEPRADAGPWKSIPGHA